MKKLPLFIILIAIAGCDAISGLRSPVLLDMDKGRLDCKWSDWQAYGEKVLGTEETSSVTFSIEGGYTSRIGVQITHKVSLRVASRLKKECRARGPVGEMPVKTEYSTGHQTWWRPCGDGIAPVDIALGDYMRWEVLKRSGEDGRWAVYKGRATFFVLAEGMNITDTPHPQAVKTLILSVNGREVSRLYLHN